MSQGDSPPGSYILTIQRIHFKNAIFQGINPAIDIGDAIIVFFEEMLAGDDIVHTVLSGLVVFCSEQIGAEFGGFLQCKGIGFFENSNFYPDFILWLNNGEHQHVVFIDPKGIRNLKNRLENEKINLFKELKAEIEPSLRDVDIKLNSFIISNTKYREVNDWGSQKDFADHHVLFQKDDDRDYIEQMLSMIVLLDSKSQD